MSTPFEFMSNPVVPGQQNIGYIPPQQQMMPQPAMYPAYTIPNTPPPEAPIVTGHSFGFTVVPDDPPAAGFENMTLPAVQEPALPAVPKKRRTKEKIIKPSDADNSNQIEDMSAMYTYAQTTMMLHETVNQLDMLAGEVKSELDNVRLSRTYKNKHNTMVGLTTALGKILETKVSAISQINNSISKANDLDYKREKDRKTAEANVAMDDKHLMDLYTSFVSNPMANENMANVLGPNIMQTTVAGSNIIRANAPGDMNNNLPANVDVGYLNYINNMTPEQNAMLYESNPNVQNCVVYDMATGMKTFQMIDISTGMPVPNLQALDNRFMEDTYIDMKTKTASNSNLHQTYPVIVINETASQY